MEQLYAKLDALREGDILVLAGSLPGGLPSDTYRRILDRLAGRGIQAAVDTAGEALAAVLPARPFLIKPNHCELTALVGPASDHPNGDRSGGPQICSSRAPAMCW